MLADISGFFTKVYEKKGGILYETHFIFATDFQTDFYCWICFLLEEQDRI